MSPEYISADAVLERFKSSPIAGTPNQTEGKLTERIWDALDFIGTNGLYVKDVIVLDVSEGSVRIPKNIRVVDEVLNDRDLHIPFSLRDGRVYVDSSVTLIKVVVKRLLQDEDGRPLIPNQTEYLNAVDYYLKWKAAEDGVFLRSVDSNLLLYIKNECSKYMNACRNYEHSITTEKGRQIMNIMRRPIIDMYGK